MSEWHPLSSYDPGVNDTSWGKNMRDEDEIKVAWEIWNLISRLNDLIWDFYEEDFIELLKKEYGKRQTDSQDKTKPSD
jgi:hypothetical protein